MRHLLVLIVLAIVMASCGGSQNSAQPSQKAEQPQTATSKVFKLDSLLAVADQKVDQTVKVRGVVTHTCKHSGKRCFLAGESKNASLRVEAKGDIGGFNRELIGFQLEITGIVRERRLTREYLDQTEKDLIAKKAEDGSAESCQAELSNIGEMRAKMKELGRNYYSIFYMDGLSYELVK